MSWNGSSDSGSAEPRPSEKAAVMPPLNRQQRRTLLELARNSLEHGLRVGCALDVDIAAVETRLREPQACFVTLTRERELRGCVGTLEARGPLAQEVAISAYNAGFCDPRMLPVREGELPELRIEISVLSPLEDLPPMSEETLLRHLRPHVDGVVLSEGSLRATLLPKVWQSLPEPAVFLVHLKRKAGLPDDYWSSTIRFRRYRTECFGDAEP